MSLYLDSRLKGKSCNRQPVHFRCGIFWRVTSFEVLDFEWCGLWKMWPFTCNAILAMSFFLLLSNLTLFSLFKVFGTSLSVAPFNSLVGKTNSKVPRVYINKTKPGAAGGLIPWFMGLKADVNFDRSSDTIILDDCDKTVEMICNETNWTEDLRQIIVNTLEPWWHSWKVLPIFFQCRITFLHSRISHFSSSNMQLWMTWLLRLPSRI